MFLEGEWTRKGWDNTRRTIYKALTLDREREQKHRWVSIRENEEKAGSGRKFWSDSDMIWDQFNIRLKEREENQEWNWHFCLGRLKVRMEVGNVSSKNKLESVT